jgi:hypothetical protein
MIIGFAFSARAGKDTSADYLVNTYSFLKDSFAYSLKEGIGKGVFGFTDEQLELTKEIPDDFWGMSPRQALQLAGTEGGRNIFGQDLWVKTLQRRVQQHPTRNYAISDIRFKNEAEAIKAMGGIVIKINRTGAGTASKHSSETELENYTNWDAELDNNGDFNHLYAQLDQIVSKYVLKETDKPKKKRGPKPKKKLEQ